MVKRGLSVVVTSVALGHPIDEEGVRHRKHHRPDEEPDHPEGDEPADHADEDQQEWQVGAAPDQDGAKEVVERPAEDRPDEEGRTPPSPTPRVDPDRRREEYQP